MTKIIIAVVAVLLATFGIYSLFQTGASKKANTPTEKIEIKKQVKKEINKNTKNMKAILKTNQGDIIVELFADKAPNTVENFTKLAKADFYNGVKFHRVIKGFMIQGGDPLSKDDAQMARWGTGGPGYKFDDELPAQGEYKIGSLAMANSGPNTNGSQFFIVTGDNGVNLPPLYALFGQVVDGMDAVTKIENTAVGQADRPVEPMVIESVEIMTVE